MKSRIRPLHFGCSCPDTPRALSNLCQQKDTLIPCRWFLLVFDPLYRQQRPPHKRLSARMSSFEHWLFLVTIRVQSREVGYCALFTMPSQDSIIGVILLLLLYFFSDYIPPISFQFGHFSCKCRSRIDKECRIVFFLSFVAPCTKYCTCFSLFTLYYCHFASVYLYIYVFIDLWFRIFPKSNHL